MMRHLSYAREFARAAATADPRVFKIAAAAVARPGPWQARIEALRPVLSTEGGIAEPTWGDRTIGQHTVISSIRPRQGRFLYSMMRRLRPASVIEMGTSVGLSGAYIGAALKDNGAGRLITLEGAEAVADTARGTFDRLGLSDVVEVRIGWFDDTYEQALKDAAPVGVVFIDGNHYEAPTWRYFEEALPHLAPGAILTFDDIRWSREMERVWARVRGDNRTRFSLTFDTVGIWAPR